MLSIECRLCFRSTILLIRVWHPSTEFHPCFGMVHSVVATTCSRSGKLGSLSASSKKTSSDWMSTSTNSCRCFMVESCVMLLNGWMMVVLKSLCKNYIRQSQILAEHTCRLCSNDFLRVEKMRALWTIVSTRWNNWRGISSNVRACISLHSFRFACTCIDSYALLLCLARAFLTIFGAELYK